MKTALRELVDWIEQNNFPVNKEFVLKTKELSEKERVQIISAFEDGISWDEEKYGIEFPMSHWKTAKDYYQNKYQTD
jgi:hypothetical protein